MLSNGNKLSKNILILLNPYKKRIFLLVLCVVVTSVMSIFNPIINKYIIDKGVMARDLDAVIKFTIIILAMYIGEQIIGFIEFRQYSYINNMLTLDLFLKAFKHTMKLKMAYFYDTNISKIMTEVNQDVASIAAISEKNILVSVTQVLRVIGGIIGLILISWKLTLFVLAAIPLKLLMTALLSRKRQEATKDIMDAGSKFSFWYGETVGGIAEVKLWNLYTKKINEFIKHQRALIKFKIRGALVDLLNQSSELTLQAVIFNALYVIGAAMIIKSDFTIGGMLSFIMYSSYVVEPMALIANIFYQFSNVRPAMQRYIKFINTEGEALQGSNKIRLPDSCNFPRTIKFDNVSLAYRDENAISNLSLEIERGQKIAIIGMNGSGKSSLINLLLRLYSPTSGKIYMDDKDISDIYLNDYRDLFAVMSQNIYLFNSTIEENIKMYGDVTEEEVVKSCIESDAMGFIENLQDKFKTPVGFRGSKLSGGERQKVALARALAKKANIMILDEATSNYDYESEQLFNKVVKENTKYQFVFVISHRPDILKSVDKILVLEKGSVAGFGSYNQLYGQNMLFTGMVDNTYAPVEVKKEPKKAVNYSVRSGNGQIIVDTGEDSIAEYSGISQTTTQAVSQ